MIQDYLECTAMRLPAHPAVILGKRSVSFGELRTMSEAVCAYFRRKALRRGDSVLLVLDNGPEYAAFFFGILRAGGVIVPLNVANTADSVRFVTANCSARHAVVSGRALEHFRGWWAGEDIVTDSRPADGTRSIREVLGTLPGPASAAAGAPGDLALVLYTSGTTGQPKGVMLSHANLEANTQSILGYLPLTRSDRTLAILPFCYSYGNSLLLTHVCAGATLVVENAFAFVNKALETMRKQRVTGFSGVPSHYNILIRKSRFLSQEWPDLRYMTCAGGGLPPVHIRELRKAMPHVAFHAMYGQTEGAARLSSLDPQLLDRKIGSIGRGIPGVEMRVVDAGMADVKPGDIGEIVARGGNIMRGYLGDPQGTEEALKNGWLHTGDLATVDDEGFIFVRGREKEFIKSGGYRVGPQQVEEIVLMHPSVQECAVVGVPDDIFGEKIVAFVTLRTGADPSRGVDDVLAFARGKLPNYMVPQLVHRIDVIPKTESGKVRRLDLRDRALQLEGVRRPARKEMTTRAPM